MAKKKVVTSKVNFKSLKAKLGKKNNSKNSLPISYDLSNELRNLWLEPIDIPDKDLVLIGLQFCFVEVSEEKTSGLPKKVKVIKKTLPHVKVRQVYIDNNDGKVHATDAQNPVLKEHAVVYQLNGKNALTALNHLSTVDVPEVQVDNLFERLEFYPKNNDIDFVFFSIERLNHFIKHYSRIHLSGCQISFGRKPSSPEKGAKHSSTPCFSLKIEGEVNTTTLKTNNQNLEETVFEGVTIGSPCPPTWYIYDEIIAGLPSELKSNDTVMQGIRGRLTSSLSVKSKPLTSTPVKNNPRLR